MSDDLVKRLRRFDWGLDELEIVDQAADRIEELEAKLAKAVAAGVRVRDYYENHGSNDVYAVSDFNAVISEMKLIGQNNE